MAFCICPVAIHKGLCSLPLGMLTGRDHGVGICVSGTLEVLGVPMGQLGNPQVRHPQWLMSGLPDGVCDAVSRIHIILTSSKSPGSCSPSHFLTLSCEVHLIFFWMGQGRMVSLQHFIPLGILSTHLHAFTFPHRRSQAKKLCHLGGGGGG